MKQDKTSWGFKSVDAVKFGNDLIKIFYQDPKDSSFNWFDYNKKTDKFTAYGQLLAPGIAARLSPLLAVTWKDEGPQKIRVYYYDSKNIVKEIIFDDGKNPQAGPLNTVNLEAGQGSPLAAVSFKRDGVANIRLYYVGTDKKLSEFVFGAYGKAEWIPGSAIRDNMHMNWAPRISCVNLRPWTNNTPSIRLFGFDYIEKLYEHQWNEGGWNISKYPPEYKNRPINNSIDTVATRIDTDKPRSFVFTVVPFRDQILERFRIGDVFESGKQTIKLDRVHPFTIISDPLNDKPDHMHMFMTNGRDFSHYERTGTWSEVPVPQVRPDDGLTDVDSIKTSIDAAKAKN